MTITLEEPDVSAPATPAEHLRAIMTAVRLRTHAMGVRKALSRDQTERAAESFDAEGDYLSVAKRLLDTKHPAYRSVTRVRNDIVSYWRGMTLPYPEPGIRLIRQDQVESFHTRAGAMREELMHAVSRLDLAYGELREAARLRLGDLYDAADYRLSLVGAFDFEWDLLNLEPPNYLRQLAPDVYRRESQRIAQRFEEAVELAEQGFMEEFGKLVGHITERLTGQDEDGKPKVFRDSAVANLKAFFERFRTLNVRSNAELDGLIESAQQAVQGVQPKNLRQDVFLRERVAQRLGQVQSTLDGMLVDRPRRRVIRPAGRGGE